MQKRMKAVKNCVSLLISSVKIPEKLFPDIDCKNPESPAYLENGVILHKETGICWIGKSIGKKYMRQKNWRR
ncbi:hypothetical protein D3C87_28360 [compost metagenome]